MQLKESGRAYFIWETAIKVEAATLDEANAILNERYEADSWCATDDGRVEVFAPGGEPVEVEEVEEVDGSACLCPPDLAERGGFVSWCPVHGSGVWFGDADTVMREGAV